MLPVLLSKVLSAIWPRPVAAGRAAGWDSAAPSKRLNLALQGGGAHGAFTWGVLDRLLADGRVAIDGISGASAGAVNAVMLADGLARGGPQEARRAARANSGGRQASAAACRRCNARAIARLFAFVPRHGTPMPWLGALSRYLSPYDLNPLNINPLQGLIERFVDFDRIRDDAERELFISADQCPFRRAAGVHARGDHRRGGDGVGLPAAPVPRGRDRRRALLGRRLQRQSDGAAVPRRHPRPRTC